MYDKTKSILTKNSTSHGSWFNTIDRDFFHLNIYMLEIHWTWCPTFIILHLLYIFRVLYIYSLQSLQIIRITFTEDNWQKSFLRKCMNMKAELKMICRTIFIISWRWFRFSTKILIFGKHFYCSPKILNTMANCRNIRQTILSYGRMTLSQIPDQFS